MFGNPSDPATTMVPGATYRSPKRKRDVVEEAEDNTPPASPTSTLSVASYPELRLLEGEELGRYSPRTVVAGRFKELTIRESIPHSIPIAQWHGSSGSTAENTESTAQAESLQLSPQKSVTKTNQSEVSKGNESNEEHKDQTQPTIKSTNGPSRHKAKAVSPTKSRRKKSPPPDDSAILSLTWDDSEITGHDPTDPNDDGYGINGIGFRPTAAIAWARSQQRQKQVAEWKNREAKEAREKRRQRREGASQAKSEYDPGGAVQKKVKFDLR